MGITVLSPGLLTTIQDLGRIGYQKYGMTCCGAMDCSSLRKANYLVGNNENDAALELTFYGGTYYFDDSAIIALTGADMMATLKIEDELEPKTISRNQPILIPKGATLELGLAKKGRYAYLSIAGGFNIPKIMNSYSTNLKCKMGGFHGRKLLSEDKLLTNGISTNSLSDFYSNLKNRTVSDLSFEKEPIIHIIAGPQEEYFKEESIHAFYSSPYQITNDSDRMGYRLEGTPLISNSGTDIVSDGIVFGSIQVPSNGKPIILMADHQTTGGYAKIGTVCLSDLNKLAQCPPKTTIHFKKISVEEAQTLYKTMRQEEYQS